MLPGDSSNEQNEQSQNFEVNEDMTMENEPRRGRRETDSSMGRNH